VFMFSTVNYFIGDIEYRNDTKMTSPDPFLLQSLLRKAKKEGCEIAVIETSSHALFMHRVWGIDYDIALLTNITQDHLDLHHTMDNYVKTKLKLFKKLISSNRKSNIKKTGIINLDSDYKDLFLSETYDILTTYGMDFESNLKPTNVVNSIDYTTFDVKIPGQVLKIKTKLRGKHNIYNILGAIGVYLSIGMKPEEIEKSILEVESIPGRLEEIQNIEGFKIYVDYAHTADALEKVLQTVKNIDGVNRVLCVFGATGDRDKTKRPIMGRVVSENSDVVYLTQDDDYSEPTMQIIKDIIPGIPRVEGDNFWIIPDRESAIRSALLEAKTNDIVIITGKGDEHIMMTNSGPIEYNDKEIVLKILKEIDLNKIIG
ncbi:MAG: UDP-N-acetylmuramyl-tripeptide synthetase, partial [Candidatus Gracilibacteria bacterium]|nr:UDP-N-acetylmuramyl-tripeptide synthetase [Candidatus Gracilibacteria bacterium]